MATDTVIQLQLPAAYHHLSMLETPINTLLNQVEQLPDRTIVAYNIRLALHEVCTNIVDHAYKDVPEGQIRLTLTFKADTACFVAETCDTGRAFDPSQVPQPDLSEPWVRGYGLFLVHSLMDEVSYTCLPEGNHWRLVKHVAVTEGARDHYGDHQLCR
ncbi:MAG: ATP-binding protein [Chloroflexota bacterium]